MKCYNVKKDLEEKEMKIQIKIATLAAAAMITAGALGGCSLIAQEQNDLNSGLGELFGELSDLQSKAEQGKNDIDQLMNGNFDLDSFLNEKTVIDDSDKLSIASGVSNACTGFYEAVVTGKVNADNDKSAYTVDLPAEGASLSERNKAASKLTVGDAMKYVNSDGVSLEGIYYLKSDGGDEHKKGSVIADTDDYYSEVKGLCSELKKTTTFAEMYE